MWVRRRTKTSNSMKILVLICLCCFILISHRVACGEQPPRGWNSYDAFSWTINEQEFLESAEILSKRLGPHGYEYAVVDYLWYRRRVEGANADSLGFDVIDEWGRVIPDPDRWPSSTGLNGFFQVSTKLHAMGLKFGIHIMRGISTQAVNANTLILDPKGGPYMEDGREWRARDIALPNSSCPWMKNGFMSVNTDLGAGRAFLRSLQQQYNGWGVDFVKHDCVFGEDLDLNEIIVVSQVLKGLDRPVLYSLSPGVGATPTMAEDVNTLANMYRVTGDDWDKWTDVASHFDVSRDFSSAGMMGVEGMLGKSWPDLDMLPLGWLTDPASNEGPHRASNLNIHEQRTQMTLWCMAKSPIMFGGDLRNLNDSTFTIIANPTLLEINSNSSNNMEFPYIKESQVSKRSNHVVRKMKRIRADPKPSDAHVLDQGVPTGSRSWIATGTNGEIYLAFFNLNPDKRFISATTSDVSKAVGGRSLSGCKYKEEWTSPQYFSELKEKLDLLVEGHGCALFVITCA